MKKYISFLLVLVLALGIAGFLGYQWYRDNHVFVDGDAYDIATQSLDLTGVCPSFRRSLEDAHSQGDL